MESNTWNSLEIVKLIASLVGPAVLAVLGVYIHRVTRNFEQVQWRDQKLIEKRLLVYDDIAPLLNDVLCYFTCVGGWRDQNPPDIVALKRKIDKKVHLAAPLFSKDFFIACQEFQELCFQTYNGIGRDALLRTPFEERKSARTIWDVEWEECFSSPDQVSDVRDIRDAYTKIMAVFARDIGVNSQNSIPLSGEPTQLR